MAAIFPRQTDRKIDAGIEISLLCFLSLDSYFILPTCMDIMNLRDIFSVKLGVKTVVDSLRMARNIL